MKLERALMVGALTSAFAVVVACSSSGTGGGTGNGTGGGTGGGKEAGAADSAAEDSGGDGAAKKALGATCTVDGDCASDHCKTQGAGGGGGGGGGGTGASGTFCTLFCASPNTTPAAECTDPVFTGKCSGMSFCQVK